MTKKQLFEIQQEILSELLSGRPIDEKLKNDIRDFEFIVNAKVDAFVETIKALSYELKKFNDLADELCTMRNTVQKVKKQNEEGIS